MTVEDHGARVGTWLELVRRARIPGDVKFVGITLATYANNDGTGIHCSVSRLAADTDMGYSTVRAKLAWLRKVGLVEIAKRGNRRRRLADEYRLIIRADLLEHVDVPDGERYKKLIGETSDAQREAGRERARRYRENQKAKKKAATEGQSNADSVERYSPVDNSPGEDQAAEGITLSHEGALLGGITLDSSRNNAEAPPSDLRKVTPHLPCKTTSHGSTTSPLGADTGRSTSYRPHAREAATNPIHSGHMDPEAARLVREASNALLAALGEEGSARATQAIYDELGTDIGASRAVIEAAQRFAQRRTG